MITKRLPRGPRTRAIASCLPAYMFALHPLLVIIGANASRLPLSPEVVGRATTAVVCSVTVALFALRATGWDLGARGAWLAAALWLWTLFQPATALLRLDPTHPVVAGLYVGWSFVGASIIVQPWRRPSWRPLVPNVIAVSWVVGALWPALSAHTASQAAYSAASRISEHAPDGAAHGEAGRDIYYLVLDGLGRPDVLRDLYDLDVSDPVNRLQALGFSVPTHSVSNYSQTFLSLASTLNMSYLDSLAETMGPAHRDLRPLKRLIDDSALMRLAQQRGYRLMFVGSDYATTEHHPLADVCVCTQPLPHQIEHAAMLRSPLAALPVNRWAYDAHREKVMHAVTAIERLSAESGPKFLFAHIVAPHPPFVFGADGSPRWPAGPFTLRDPPSHEYRPGYRDQAQFVVGRLIALVETILRREGPAPVIVLQADHGPGPVREVTAAAMSERMKIFAAYYLPGVDDVVYASMTPINGTRIVAQEYLGARFSRLPDWSFFSTSERPYDFVRVPPEDTAGMGADAQLHR